MVRLQDFRVACAAFGFAALKNILEPQLVRCHLHAAQASAAVLIQILFACTHISFKLDYALVYQQDTQSLAR